MKSLLLVELACELLPPKLLGNVQVACPLAAAAAAAARRAARRAASAARRRLGAMPVMAKPRVRLARAILGIRLGTVLALLAALQLGNGLLGSREVLALVRRLQIHCKRANRQSPCALLPPAVNVPSSTCIVSRLDATWSRNLASAAAVRRRQ